MDGEIIPLVDFARFFELSVDPLCIADTTGKFLRVNLALEKLLGYSAEELTTRIYLEFVHPDDLEATLAEAARLAAGHPTLNFENRYRCRDGSWRRLSWRIAPPDENGQLYCVARDTTEQGRRDEITKSAQRRVLRFQQTLLRLRDEDVGALGDFLKIVTQGCATALETERVGVWFFAEDGARLECRDIYHRTTGLHERGLRLERDDFPEYFQAISSHDALLVEDAATDPATRPLAAACLDPHGITSALVMPIRTGNHLLGVLCCEHAGARRKWEPQEEKFATNVAAYVVLAVERDERLRHEAEVRELNATLEQRIAERTSQLRESEEQFRAAMENSAIGMALVAPDGRWMKANQAMCEILGYGEAELLELDFQSITHPDDLGADLDLVRQVLAGEMANYQMEKRYFHKDGAIVWALLNVSLVRGGDGCPRYFISQVLDITDRKVAEEMRQTLLERQIELTSQAQAGERAKSEFLAMMSHEVRTPMNGILGFAEMIANLPGLAEEGRDYAETIVRSGTTLLRILDDILDVSRLEAGAVGIELAPFSPVELLHDIRTLLRPAALAKKIEIRLSIGDGTAGVFLGDAGRLRQIVLNLGGNAIKFTEEGSVTLGVRRLGEEFEFFVRDTGCGIDSAGLERLFEPFVQGDSSNSRRYGGAGLGLSISRRLARLMDGSLTGTSDLGSGSEFVARIPLRPISVALPPVISVAAGHVFDTGFAQKYPLSILVAEDDPVNLKLIMTMLNKLGYDPLFAQDGLETVRVYRQARPQCVLMDVQMPLMDGIDATREIRDLEALSDSRPAFIFALTADTLLSDRARCMEAGMDDFLNKPLRRAQLARMLEKAREQVTAWASQSLNEA